MADDIRIILSVLLLVLALWGPRQILRSWQRLHYRDRQPTLLWALGLALPGLSGALIASLVLSRALTPGLLSAAALLTLAGGALGLLADSRGLITRPLRTPQ